jgi:hypothetical protein
MAPLSQLAGLLDQRGVLPLLAGLRCKGILLPTCSIADGPGRLQVLKTIPHIFKSNDSV